MPYKRKGSPRSPARMLLLSLSLLAAITSLAMSVYVAMEYRGIVGRSIGYVHGWVESNYTIPPGTYRVETRTTVDLGSVIQASNVSERLMGYSNVSHKCVGGAELRGVHLRVVETARQPERLAGYNLSVYGDGVLLAWVRLNPHSLEWSGGEAFVGMESVESGGPFAVWTKGVAAPGRGGLVALRVDHYLKPGEAGWGLPENITVTADLEGRAGSFAVAVSLDYSCVKTISMDEGVILKTRLPLSGELDARFSGDLGFHIAGLAAAVAVASLASVLAALSAGLAGSECAEQEPPSPKRDGPQGG